MVLFSTKERLSNAGEHERKVTLVVKLLRFDLRNPYEWDQFYNLFSAYLAEVCDREEYQENINDLHDDDLNRQMIEQTLQEHDPYFVMRILLEDTCIGLISYSYNEKGRYGFINNFYVCPEYRKYGHGSAVLMLVETALKELGAVQIALIPVRNARQFYARYGYAVFRTTVDGEQVYCKVVE